MGLITTITAWFPRPQNPRGAELLEPLTADAPVSNIFGPLQLSAPDFRSRVAAFFGTTGIVCGEFQMQVRVGMHGKHDAQLLLLT